MLQRHKRGLQLLTLLIFSPLPGYSDSAPSNTAVFEHFSYQGETLEQITVGNDEYRNPILSGYYPDPSLTRVGDDFYLANSSFTHFPGLPVFHSRNLVNWSQVGNAINREDQFDFNSLTVSRGIFAPDISFHDGLFYIISTCVDCGGNFVMTAKDPAGPWSDRVWLGFEGIDPSIYWEDDKAWVVNNGAPDKPPEYDGHRAIWIQEFDSKNMRMRGERKVLVDGGVDITKKPIWIEGPHIFKRGDFYYLTAAEGGTSEQHSQTIFRSGSVWGPFEPARHNPILTQRDLDPARPNPVTSAGHAKFVQLANGEWWATFLATRPYGPNEYNIGRETFLLPVTWENDWPTILPSGAPIPYVHGKPPLPEGPKPQLPTSGNFAFTEEFDSEQLGMEWLGYRTPGEPVYSLQNGQLSLGCEGGFGDLSGPPSFIGRRQQHHIASVSTTFSFAPKMNGDRAGLAAVQNDTSLAFFGVERIDDQNYLVVSTRDNSDEDKLVAKTPLNHTGDITLLIKAHGGKMDFEYSQAGKKQSMAKSVDARILSTRRAGGFVGTLVGPYCESGVATYADDKPLNFVHIIMDDLRTEGLKAYGDETMITPSLDRLASEGVVFDRSYANFPSCGASRASLLTGLRPTQHRFTRYDARIDVDAAGVITLPGYLKQNGYRTISLGKVIHARGDSDDAWSIEPWDAKYAPDNKSGYFDYSQPENIEAFLNSCKERGICSPSGEGKGPAYERADVPDETYIDGKTAVAAINALEDLKEADVPFYLVVGFVKPHLPFTAPKKYWDLYDRDKIDMSPAATKPEDAPGQAWHPSGELRDWYDGIPEIPPQWVDNVPAETARILRHGYFAAASYSDAQVGKVLDALERLKLADNTVVIFTGDHGFSLGDHTLWNKHSLFTLATQSPLIIRKPGSQKGRNVSGVVEYVDLYPTVVELAGLPRLEHLQGESLAPNLDDVDAPTKPAIFTRYQAGENIHTDRYSYSAWFEDGTITGHMLYDRQTDPLETINVADHPDYQGVMADLQETLKTHIAQREAQARRASHLND